MAEELTIRWDVERVADGRYAGRFVIPLIGPFTRGTVTATTLSPDGYDAALKSGTVAKQILSNPLLNLIAPPGALPAAAMAADLLKDLRSGTALQAISKTPAAMRKAAEDMVSRIRSILGYLPEEIGALHDQEHDCYGISDDDEEVAGYGYPYGQGGGY